MIAVPTETAHTLPKDVLSLLQRVAPLLSEVTEPHLVGGLLRDTLLGRATRDLDIIFQEDALPVARRVADALGGALVVLDESRRIARVVLGNGEGEGLIKKEGDRTWHLDFASLQGDLHQDLARRDFTIDAMAVPLPRLLAGDWQEVLLDPFNGRQDLERHLIRAVSPTIFQDDGVRLLRAVRLAGLLGFALEEQTRDLIRRDAAALDTVSAERTRDELLGILAIPNAMASVYLMDDLGLLCRMLPELEEGRNVQQPKEHYWDVFHHNLQTVGAVEGLMDRTWEPSWVLEEVPWSRSLEEHFSEIASDGHTRGTLCKLAGLLHDIAKPATKTVEESGRIRFFGHHTQGAAMAGAALQRLRLSRRGAQMIELMVELHLRPGQMRHGSDLPTAHAVYRFFRRAGDVAIDTLYLNLADYLAARGQYLEREEWADYAGAVRHIMETGQHQEETTVLPKLLDGRDLMRALSLEPGPQVGKLLETVREAWAAGEIVTKEEALALARDRFMDMQGDDSHA